MNATKSAPAAIFLGDGRSVVPRISMQRPNRQEGTMTKTIALMIGNYTGVRSVITRLSLSQ